MRKVNEIFYSLQGEGYNTGTPAIFVRFCGCNLKCPFCDTEFESGNEMTDDEIINEVCSYKADLVILTGGEPSLSIDAESITKLHKSGKKVAIETNGTNPLPENIDWVSCSPKEGAKLYLSRADELKIVYTGQDLSLYDDFQAANRYLQPCSCSNTAEVIDYILNNPEWRLSLQTHKLIDIR